MELQLELDALCAETGDAYLLHRDQLLARGAADVVPLAAAAAATTEGLVATHARILLGWREHGALYRDVLQKIAATDVTSVRGRAGGLPSLFTGWAARAHRELGEPILPLCWEMILKLEDLRPAWHLKIALRMIDSVRRPTSLEPLLAFIAATRDAQLREYAGDALQVLGRKVVERRVEQEMDLHRGAAELLARVLREAK